MWLLRTIRKDLRWLNSFSQAVKVAGLIFVIALMTFAWRLGLNWWLTPRRFMVQGVDHIATPLRELAVYVGIFLLVYIIYARDRDRK